MTDTMFARLGGHDTMVAVVDTFYNLVLADDSLAHYFIDVDMAKLKRHQALMIGQVLGGPVSFELDVPNVAHKDLNIINIDYWLVCGYLFAVLTGFNVDHDILEHVFRTLCAVRERIVHD